MPPVPASPVVAQEEVGSVVAEDQAPVENSFPKPTDNNHSTVVVPETKGSGPIEVVALRPGFYKHSRRETGDVFTVPRMEKVGTWMKCTDSVLEKKHQEMMKEAKRKAMEKQKAEL